MDRKRFLALLIIILLFLFLLILSIMYYNGKYKVYFETGTTDEILTQYIKKNKKATKPNDPSKDGFIFIEWQLDGKKYDFNQPVKEDIILTAKWIREEYITVTFDTNSNEVIEPIKILKGSNIDNLPTIDKTGFEFVGWYINDKKYDNENINSNITLVAKYNKKADLNDYSIGDCVIIIGNYSNSTLSNSAEYDIAVGWTRYVLAIYNNTNYPLMIGNNKGVTGFFKASSVKLCD